MRATVLRACLLGSLCAAGAVAAAGCQNGPTTTDDLVVVVTATTPPPPLSGGTMIVTSDESRAIAADSDRDILWIVDLRNQKFERSVALDKGDEPGRLVEDSAGLVHVALRGAGEVITVDPSSGKVLRRTPVCGAPRGMAFDASKNQLHVACAEGHLVTLDPQTGAELRRLTIDSDLRDVIIEKDHLLLTRFRSAEILSVNAAGQVTSRAVPETTTSFLPMQGIDGHFTPDVAWRTVPLPSGGAVMVHQRAQVEEVEIDIPGGYGDDGSGTGGIVQGGLTQISVDDDGMVTPSSTLGTLFSPVLPVDVAVSRDGSLFAVAAAGSKNVISMDALYPGSSGVIIPTTGMPVAVAYAGNQLIAQVREPAAIELVGLGKRIVLPGVSVRDTGFEMFHLPPGSFQGTNGFGDPHSGDMNGEGDFGEEPPSFMGGAALACASCHPEGGDDSHTWTFQNSGARRTQTMRGDVLETLPLHWEGDMTDVGSIMGEVFTRRMGGPQPGPAAVKAISGWVSTIGAPPAMRSSEDRAVVRGKVIFENPTVGCASCHSGPHFTNNQNAAIGKGEALQVPSLVGVAWRAPYMHDGCAATLKDRFDPQCGGTMHGDVSKLTRAQLDDLIAYLESL